MDIADGVAARVAGLCLDERDRPADWLICSHAVRAGLLLDLGLAGRIAQTDESIVIDGTPTGFPPADRLLAAVLVEPERSLDGWFAEHRIGLRDLVEANVGSGRWRRLRLPFRRDRYEDLRSAETARDRARPADGSPDGWTEEDACVTAVAAASGLHDRTLGRPFEPPAAVVAATGPVAWLCQAAVDHLLVHALRYRDQAGALRAGGGGGPF